MTAFEMILLFLIISLGTSIWRKNATFSALNDIRTYSSHFPQWYIAPAKWVRKVFKVKDRIIPRYLYFGFFMTLFYAILAPINILVSLVVMHSAPIIPGILAMAHASVFLLDVIVYLIVVPIIKK